MEDRYSRERWRSESGWGHERNPSPERPYGDGEYGWHERPRYERVSPPDYPDYSRRTYAGPYGRERYASEWSRADGWQVPGPYVGRGPRDYQRSDERICEEINERLTAHGLIDATDIECRVQNGEVTLTGFVDSRAAKRAAEDLAESVSGVRDVHNQLRVRSQADDEGVGRTSVLGITEHATQVRRR